MLAAAVGAALGFSFYFGYAIAESIDTGRPLQEVWDWKSAATAAGIGAALGLTAGMAAKYLEPAALSIFQRSPQIMTALGQKLTKNEISWIAGEADVHSIIGVARTGSARSIAWLDKLTFDRKILPQMGRINAALHRNIGVRELQQKIISTVESPSFGTFRSYNGRLLDISFDSGRYFMVVREGYGKIFNAYVVDRLPADINELFRQLGV